MLLPIKGKIIFINYNGKCCMMMKESELQQDAAGNATVTG
jgi:hypothetical protein